MKKILILTAGYGEGHNAAARGLKAAFDQHGSAEAEVADPCGDALGALYERSRRSYLDLINRAPYVWAALYRLIDVTPLIHAIVPTLGNVQRALQATVSERRPDIIVSTYPVYNYLLDRLHCTEPLRATIVTDSISINSVWHRCGSDLFYVPNEDTARVMRRAGVPEEKLRVLGFPVPPRFAADRPPRPAPSAEHPPRVLFMVNAAKNRAPGIVARLLRIPRIHLAVTVGKDEELRRAVEEAAQAAGRPVEIHGWTPHMPELLMSHHVLIGKAGGAAVQETIAARTPMLMTHVVPGQEEGNAQLLVRNGCGQVCGTAERIARAVERLFANDASEWREWERNIARISRPDASLQIADSLLSEAARRAALQTS